MKIIQLTNEYESKYTQFLLQDNRNLFYASLAYRNFLRKILPESYDHYLLLLEGNTIVGVLPAFIYDSHRNGKIMNSLPFYGSNGAIVLHPSVTNANTCKKLLLNAFVELAEKEKVKAATIITNPLLSDHDFYEKHFSYTHRDTRIGQLKHLMLQVHNQPISDILLKSYHQKTRNLVRKGLSQQFHITHDSSLAVLKWLYTTHKENMQIIGGRAKPWSVFEALRDTLRYNEQYRIYIAEDDGEKASALLVLYFNQCVEYFTPVIKHKYRNKQVLSALIHNCMIDAIKQGYQWWNWGGTWNSQKGVYHFKKRWGTENFPYYYFTKIYDEDLLTIDKSIILPRYPNYYVYPF